jgi:hypothetical protein
MAGQGATVELQVLYFDGCPNHERLLPVLRELAAQNAASSSSSGTS